MNKKFLSVAAILAAVSLAGCSETGTSSVLPVSSAGGTSLTSVGTTSESSAPTTSIEPEPSSSPSTSSISSIPVETFEVVLPNDVAGVSITASNLTPEAGEEVSLYVTTTAPESRRVDAVKVNGETLQGTASDTAHCMIYTFTMPSGRNAAVTVEAVDVYAVGVADSVQAYLSLAGIGNGLFAAGETVTFTPTTFAGYWYKYVAVVEEDVILTPVENSGAYTFTMPSHAVTITAVTGENVYAVTYDSTDGNYSINISNGKTYAIGSTVTFTVTSRGYDSKITGVRVEGQLLEPDADTTNTYSFVMPTYPVEISVDYDLMYRSFTTVSSDHFDASLKTVIDDEEVDVTDSNVLSGKKVYIYVSDKTPDVAHKFVVKDITVKYGSTAETTTSSLTVTKESDGVYSFTTYASSTALFYTVTVNEYESAVKGLSIIGSYTAYHPYYSSSTDFTIDEGANLKIGTSNYGTLAADPEDANHFTASSYHVFYNEALDAILVIGSSFSYTYLGVKENYTTLTSDSSFETFALKLNTTASKMQYFQMTLDDGSVITALYSFDTNSVEWSVTAEMSGTEEPGVGSIYTIKSASGSVLARWKVTKVHTKSDGYQHDVEVLPSDGYQGQYANGEDTLSLDGYGEATYNGETGTYVVDNGVVVVTLGSGSHYFVVDTEALTFADSAAPTDGYEGTYTGAAGDLVLDGYGSCSFGGETDLTYELTGSAIVVKATSGDVKYFLDRTSHTYSAASIFSGYTFGNGTFNNSWGDPYSLEIVFDDSAEISGTIKMEGNLYTVHFTGSYDAATGILTMTVATGADGSTGTIKLTAGTVITASLSGNTLTMLDNVNSFYTTSGAVVTCDDFPVASEADSTFAGSYFGIDYEWTAISATVDDAQAVTTTGMSYSDCGTLAQSDTDPDKYNSSADFYGMSIGLTWFGNADLGILIQYATASKRNNVFVRDSETPFKTDGSSWSMTYNDGLGELFCVTKSDGTVLYFLVDLSTETVYWNLSVAGFTGTVGDTVTVTDASGATVVTLNVSAAAVGAYGTDNQFCDWNYTATAA